MGKDAALEVFLSQKWLWSVMVAPSLELADAGELKPGPEVLGVRRDGMEQPVVAWARFLQTQTHAGCLSESRAGDE